jgi:hypothetical protein
MQPRHIFTALSILVFHAACGLAADAPSKDDAPKPDKDGWYSLFNGKDFTGWKVSKENADTFKIENGEIVANGPPAHLYYDGPVNKGNFKNFQWKCEIMTKPHSNSGMYFHTKYQPSGWPTVGIEVQVNNTHDDPIKTGSVYRLKNIMNDSPAKDNEWFTQEVIVKGNHVTVKVNDKVVNEYEQPKDLKRDEGWGENVISPNGGTFALQGHDPGSEVHYRKVLVKPRP